VKTTADHDDAMLRYEVRIAEPKSGLTAEITEDTEDFSVFSVYSVVKNPQFDSAGARTWRRSPHCHHGHASPVANVRCDPTRD